MSDSCKYCQAGIFCEQRAAAIEELDTRSLREIGRRLGTMDCADLIAYAAAARPGSARLPRTSMFEEEVARD